MTDQNEEQRVEDQAWERLAKVDAAINHLVHQENPLMYWSVPAGWHHLVEEMHARLKEIDPLYQLLQAKEKFGTLRYYISTSPQGTVEEKNELIKRLQDVVSEYEVRSETVCERCGNEGALHANASGWRKTLCESCAKELPGSWRGPEYGWQRLL